MSKPKILVVGGGPSLEREISLISSKAVFNTLEEAGHQVTFYDWDGTTTWLDAHVAEFDVVFPILHGRGGEDGGIQALLENHVVPFLGSSSEVSKLCFDKKRTLALLESINVKIPRGDTVTLAQYKKHPLTTTAHVLKPFKGGSSIDTYVLRSPADQPLEQIEKSFSKYESMLLEEYIDGIEITVPILNNEPLPVIEIQPPKNGVFDYANKYNGKTAEFCPPKNVSQALQREVQDLALKIHTALGCRHLSRIDMIIVEEKPYVLEVNTIPGMTAQSLYPKSAAVYGLDFSQLVENFVTMATKGTV